MKNLSQLKKISLPIHMEFLVWTPEVARYALEHHNPINRSCPERAVERLAADMIDGNFAISHQGVGFDTKGNLIDGQTRLSGIVLADKPVLLLTVWDLPPVGTRWDVERGEMVKTTLKMRTQDIIDVTRSRSFADMLCMREMLADGTIDKKRNANTAAVVKTILQMVVKKNAATHSQLTQVLDMFRSDLEAIEALDRKHPGTHSYLRNSGVTAALVIAHHFRPKEIKEFVRGLYTGEMLKPEDPALTLRNKLGNLPKVNSGKISRPTLIQRATLYAARKACLKETMSGFSRLSDNSDLIYFLQHNPKVADDVAEIMHDGPKD